MRSGIQQSFLSRAQRDITILSVGATLILILGLATPLVATVADSGILQIRNGYFWDPLKGEYFIPRGISYQTWNPDVFANQSFEQVAYDLAEFRKIYANSVRAELVWSQLEVAPNTYDWEKADFLINTAEDLGLRLFLLIGYQYPPPWFPEEWYATNDQNGQSDVLNYNNPSAQSAYADHIRTVVARYQDSPAVAGWILGNEFAYFDLWEDPDRYPIRRFLGYDEMSLQAFQEYLRDVYDGDIEALNRNWTNPSYQFEFEGFEEIEMPDYYPEERDDPRYYDLMNWRKESIAQFLALGAQAAKQADPNHLISYSMVGGIFNGRDANFTGEDDRAIVQACREIGAPLDFWSINNYAWAWLGSELRSGDYGVSKYKERIGLPILISETGHSSTENLFDTANVPKKSSERQPEAIVSQIWESLMSGAAGVHIFHWNDRNGFTQDYFLRERGFGIVTEARLPKEAYHLVLDAYRQMHNIRVEHLFGDSQDPPPDVQFFWSDNSLMGKPRANQENAMLWGALKRLGLQPGIIDDAAFAEGAYLDAPVLLLSRDYQLAPEQLDRLADTVLPAGIHIHANTDIPGRFNAFHNPNANWVERTREIFGLDVSEAVPGLDAHARDEAYRRIELEAPAAFSPFPAGYQQAFQTWKIWHGVKADSGTTVLTHRGVENTRPAMPALQLKTHATAKTAVNTFALGDTLTLFNGQDAHELWDVRYAVLQAIYRTHFGIAPTVQLSGSNSHYVLPDYRICSNGTVLISLLNESVRNATVFVRAPDLISGKTVENLITGEILTENAGSTLSALSLSGDEFVLLYAYSKGGEDSLTQTYPGENRIWFEYAPAEAWIGGGAVSMTIGYDTVESGVEAVVGLEAVRPSPPRVLGESDHVTVLDRDTTEVSVPVLDADANTPPLAASPADRHHAWHARLVRNGTTLADARMPVQMHYGLNSLTTPPPGSPGSNQSLELGWEDLPSYLPSEAGTPLDRRRLWGGSISPPEFYNVVLELRSGAEVLATDFLSTHSGSGTGSFSITIPPGAAGPLSWHAYLQPSPATQSHALFDSFEDRMLGAQYNEPLFKPWESFVFALQGEARRIAHGVRRDASAGSQSAFVIAQNSSEPEDSAGFGIALPLSQGQKLPRDRKAWVDIDFSVDFKEAHQKDCTVELQVKDNKGNWIQYAQPYAPEQGNWNTVAANLAAFQPPPGGAPIDSQNIQTIAINVRMQEPGQQYDGAFDRILLDAFNVNESFEEYIAGQRTDRVDDDPLPRPAESFTYPQLDRDLWQNEGVQLRESSDGTKAAFLVVTNWIDPGAAGFGFTYNYDSEWSLPANRADWSQYRFAFDFKNFTPAANTGYPVELFLQLKSRTDDLQHAIQFKKTYEPGADGWDTIEATLDQFSELTGPQWGPFDSSLISGLVIGAIMLESDVQYVAYFDNIRFEAPPIVPLELPVLDLTDGFEGRNLGDRPELIAPWTASAYSQNNNASVLSVGVHEEASEGAQSGFVVVDNPPDPGGFSGFFYSYPLHNPFALPSDREAWSQYRFSADFREAEGLPCELQLQLKDTAGNWIQFKKAYTPGDNGWDRISAGLDEFGSENSPAPFDPTRVAELLVNVVMQQTDAVYVASFDRIIFQSPAARPLGEGIFASYGSADDAAPPLPDSDGDGVPDRYETQTGVFAGATDTGTDPNDPDTDGDGQSDGAEVIAGTDPNRAGPEDRFEFLGVERDISGAVRLSWIGRPGREYTIYYTQGPLRPNSRFLPLVSGVVPAADSPEVMEFVDDTGLNSPARFYLLEVVQPDQ